MYNKLITVFRKKKKKRFFVYREILKKKKISFFDENFKNELK